MAEDKTPAEKPKKKVRIGYQYRLALAAVKERKDLAEYHVDYKAIAQRFGVKAGVLRYYWKRHKRGEIDWGEPQSEGEVQLTNQILMERMLKTSAKHTEILVREYEGTVLRADDASDTEQLSERTAVADKVLKKLQAVLTFRGLAEKGFSNILEEITNRRLRAEKPLTGKEVAADVSTAIITMSDEARAMAALRGELPQQQKPSDAAS